MLSPLTLRELGLLGIDTLPFLPSSPPVETTFPIFAALKPGGLPLAQAEKQQQTLNKINPMRNRMML